MADRTPSVAAHFPPSPSPPTRKIAAGSYTLALPRPRATGTTALDDIGTLSSGSEPRPPNYGVRIEPEFAGNEDAAVNPVPVRRRLTGSRTRVGSTRI
jgi:hypothetical protein